MATSSKLVLSLALVWVCLVLTSGIAAAWTETPAFNPDGRAIMGLTAVTITCQTPGAMIRYTTNGLDPSPTTGTEAASGVCVYVIPGTTLKAKAWAEGVPSRVVKTATYTAQTNSIPYYIAHGTATVDGDLSDWVDAEWTPLTELYDVPLYPNGTAMSPATPDVAEAYYATRWTEDKVYVALKVRDTVHHLSSTYVAWDSHDLAEFCIHTTATGPTNYNDYGFAAAQEYVFGIRPNGASVWSTLGPTGSVSGTGVALAGRVVGQWLCYEGGLIPYQYLNRSNPSLSVISYLSAVDIIGVDPLVVANNGTTKINTCNSIGYTCMRS